MDKFKSESIGHIFSKKDKDKLIRKIDNNYNKQLKRNNSIIKRYDFFSCSIVTGTLGGIFTTAIIGNIDIISYQSIALIFPISMFGLSISSLKDTIDDSYIEKYSEMLEHIKNCPEE